MAIQNKNIIKISDEYGVGGVEHEIQRVSKTKEVSKKLKSKSSRCKDTIDWVEVEYGDEYKKPKKWEG